MSDAPLTDQYGRLATLSLPRTEFFALPERPERYGLGERWRANHGDDSMPDWWVAVVEPGGVLGNRVNWRRVSLVG
jgi:hypothetical protein